MIDQDKLEQIGKLVDKADNYLELFKNGFMPLPMKLDAAKSGLTSLRDELKELYLSLGGEDVFWVK